MDGKVNDSTNDMEDRNVSQYVHAEPILLTAENTFVHNMWNRFKTIKVPTERKGHRGGDRRLQDKLFTRPDEEDVYERSAGSRDGAMSILVGIAARKSIESGEIIRIAELTDLEPRENRI